MKIVTTYPVEAATERECNWFGGFETVAVTAGASAPDFSIDKVATRIEEIGNIN